MRAPEGKTAIEALLRGLIDYAGLYPPAALDMQAAVHNFLEYQHSAHALALGRFVVALNGFPLLLEAARDKARQMKLTVIAAPNADGEDLHRLVAQGYAIEAVEIKDTPISEIGRIAMHVPSGLATYFEVPIDPPPAMLDAVATAGARVKLRTGGTAAEAFPSTQQLAQMLAELASRRLIFKATAGLHHPLRGRFALTYADGSPTAVMHGFMNLSTAALLHFGGDAREAQLALEEEWSGEWQIADEAIAWEQNSWNADELREVRQQFFAGFGSCSFTEPMRELEALRWL